MQNRGCKHPTWVFLSRLAARLMGSTMLSTTRSVMQSLQSREYTGQAVARMWVLPHACHHQGAQASTATLQPRLTSAATSTSCCTPGGAPARPAGASPAGIVGKSEGLSLCCLPLGRWRQRQSGHDMEKQGPTHLHDLFLAALAGSLAAARILHLQVANNSGARQGMVDHGNFVGAASAHSAQGKLHQAAWHSPLALYSPAGLGLKFSMADCRDREGSSVKRWRACGGSCRRWHTPVALLPLAQLQGQPLLWLRCHTLVIYHWAWCKASTWFELASQWLEASAALTRADRYPTLLALHRALQAAEGGSLCKPGRTFKAVRKTQRCSDAAPEQRRMRR